MARLGSPTPHVNPFFSLTQITEAGPSNRYDKSDDNESKKDTESEYNSESDDL